MDNRDEAAVRARAYQLWVESGYADGYQDQHWRQAEREVAERGAATRPPAAASASGPGESGGSSAGDAERRDRPRAGEARHSDGMSAHPSVLDPGPRRLRA